MMMMMMINDDGHPTRNMAMWRMKDEKERKQSFSKIRILKCHANFVEEHICIKHTCRTTLIMYSRSSLSGSLERALYPSDHTSSYLACLYFTWEHFHRHRRSELTQANHSPMSLWSWVVSYTLNCMWVLLRSQNVRLFFSNCSKKNCACRLLSLLSWSIERPRDLRGAYDCGKKKTSDQICRLSLRCWCTQTHWTERKSPLPLAVAERVALDPDSCLAFKSNS